MKPKQDLLQFKLTFDYLTGKPEFYIFPRKSVNVINKKGYHITINKNDYSKLRKQIFEICSQKGLEKVQWFIDNSKKAIEHYEQELEKFENIYKSMSELTVEDLDELVKEKLK